MLGRLAYNGVSSWSRQRADGLILDVEREARRGGTGVREASWMKGSGEGEDVMGEGKHHRAKGLRRR